MRKIVLLAAMLIVPGLMAGPAAAGDRGPGFRHFPPHVGAPPHVWRQGRWFQPGRFDPPRHFQPRRFGHSGAFLKFHDGSFGFRFGTPRHFKPFHFVPPHFAKPHHFGRHHHRPPALTFARPSHFKPWGFSQRHHKSWRGRSHRRW